MPTDLRDRYRTAQLILAQCRWSAAVSPFIEHEHGCSLLNCRLTAPPSVSGDNTDWLALRLQTRHSSKRCHGAVSSPPDPEIVVHEIPASRWAWVSENRTGTKAPRPRSTADLALQSCPAKYRMLNSYAYLWNRHIEIMPYMVLRRASAAQPLRQQPRRHGPMLMGAWVFVKRLIVPSLCNEGHAGLHRANHSRNLTTVGAGSGWVYRQPRWGPHFK